MNGFIINISGLWAHFKKPETNNNPLTHEIITKTAFIGLIGSVLGKSRKEMQELFPILSEDILYGVAIYKSIKKVSIGFTMRNAKNDKPFDKAPKQMEFIKNPKYDVAVYCNSDRSLPIIEKFINYITTKKSIYEPVLGLHNCPAQINKIKVGEFEKKEGQFETKGFITNSYKIVNLENLSIKLNFDQIPTYQDSEFWNPPDKYLKIIYSSDGDSLQLENGIYYKFLEDSSEWVLV